MSDKTGRFSKANRLNNPDDYRQVFKSSCRSVDGKLLVLATPNRLQIARLGLAVSKKNVHSAANRNKVKRTIRESFRQHKNILKGMDVVVVTHKKQTTINKKTFNDSISKHWNNISQCRKS